MDSFQDSYLAPFFGDISPIEKISEINPPLKWQDAVAFGGVSVEATRQQQQCNVLSNTNSKYFLCVFSHRYEQVSSNLCCEQVDQK